MAIEKVTEEIKEEEIQEQPDGLPVDVTVEGEEEMVEERPQDDFNANLAEGMMNVPSKTWVWSLFKNTKKIRLLEKNGKMLT